MSCHEHVCEHKEVAVNVAQSDCSGVLRICICDSEAI